MLRMVEQLLELSRLEAGEYRLQLTRVTPTDLLEHVRNIFSSRADAAGLELRIEVAADAPVVEADYDRLVQVLSNLLDNALRHTADGRIVLSARRAGDGIELQVVDTGEGIDPEHLPYLFDRFYQPESRTGPGSGPGARDQPRDCPGARG